MSARKVFTSRDPLWTDVCAPLVGVQVRDLVPGSYSRDRWESFRLLRSDPLPPPGTVTSHTSSQGSEMGGLWSRAGGFDLALIVLTYVRKGLRGSPGFSED